MAPTAASEPNQLYPADPGAVQLVLRYTDSRTTVVRAQLEETLDSVLERLDKPVALRGNLLVEYGGWYLPREATIGELGLPQDATLNVTVRSLHKLHHVAWGLACMITAAARLLAATGQQPDSAATLDLLVWHFLKETRAARDGSSITILGPVPDQVSLFLRSGAPGALGQLYISEDEVCRFEAERTIRWFLTPEPLTEQSILKAWTAPVLLVLSGSIATRGTDPLYSYIRRALAKVITHPGWSPACWLDVPSGRVAEHLTRFAVEKATVVMEHIDAADQMLTAYEGDLNEFKIFSWALRQQVRGIGAGTYLGAWSIALYRTLVSLVWSVDEYMAMVEAFVSLQLQGALSIVPFHWTDALPWVRIVVAELDAWSDVVQWPSIRGTLASHAMGTRVLVLSAGMEWCRSRNIRWITRHRDLLGFDTRRKLAMTLLPKLAAEDGSTATPLDMLVDRSRLLPDSLGYVSRATPEQLRAGLLVEFWHEQATGPGVRREWFCLVFQAIFSLDQGLFSACPSDRRRFFVNSSSVVNPQHYEVVGRMIALALTHRIPVGVSLDRTLYQQLAGRPMTLDDIADADPSLHASCKKILEMDPGLVDSDALGLTFAREVDGSSPPGSRTVVELMSGGRDTAVTSTNRRTYIHRLVKDQFVDRAVNQVAHLVRGFSTVLGGHEHARNFFAILDVEDFNKMLGGSEDTTIDVKEWEAHTDYCNGYTRMSRRVKWFWQAVKEMTVEERRRLLVFWTSVAYLPFDGFAGLESRLFLVRSPSSCDHLPTSNTCFYRLNLPAYTSSRMMRSRLRVIVQEHVSSSFGAC